jgi:hypothetical protein
MQKNLKILLSMLKLRGYVIYSFGYVHCSSGSKIAKAITTIQCGCKCSEFVVVLWGSVKNGVVSVMKRLIALSAGGGG